VSKIDVGKFAESLGLSSVPVLKLTKTKTFAPSLDPPEEEVVQVKKKTKLDKLFARENTTVLTPHYRAFVQEESEDDLFSLKRRNHEVEVEPSSEVLTKKRLQKLNRRAKKNVERTRLVFDEDGVPTSSHRLVPETEMGDLDSMRQEFLKVTRDSLKEVDVLDKALERDKRRERRLGKKIREKNARVDESFAPVLATRAPDDFDGDFGVEEDGAKKDEDKKDGKMGGDKMDRVKKRKRSDLESQEQLALALLNQ
jgi:ATP-dependent RNA helicase DDX10/DBP4